MRLTNQQLGNFVKRIKLKKDDRPKFNDEIDRLVTELETKINDDKRTGTKVTKVLRVGSWKKGTILRPTGDNPIDADLAFFIDDEDAFKNDINKLHDFIASYLEAIYQARAKKEIDSDGKTKSVNITFPGLKLEADVVPVLPLKGDEDYVWQPERGGTGNYTTSITKQLLFMQTRKEANSSFTSIIRALKWWKNYKELKDQELSSFAIELIVSYLEINKGAESSIEEGVIRFFEFVSCSTFPVIKFNGARNQVQKYSTPIYIADPTNNENNVARKMVTSGWNEIKKEALIAFEALNIAQSTGTEGGAIDEWKSIFGPSFNISED